MFVARVPQIMQMEVAECGAACLAMICAYHEKYVPLSKVRLDCGVSRDGCNALSLVKTARAYGFETSSVTCDLEYLRHEVTFPAILHWGFDHSVVLDGFAFGKAVINDPARGRVRVSMQTMDKMFTGVCMSFTPGPSFRKESRRPSISRYGKEQVGLMWRSLAFASWCTLMTTIVSIGFTLLGRAYLDLVLPRGNAKDIQRFSLVFLALIAIHFAASLIDHLAIRRQRTEMSVLGAVNFLWHSLCLPMEFFDQCYGADIARRLDETEETASMLASWLVPLRSMG